MAEQLPRENPYSVAVPAANGGSFFGREALFTWIHAALLQALPEEGPQHPVILRGPRHIGKSSILRQIENGRLHPPYTATYIDLAELTLTSPSSFIWDVAHTAVESLQAQKLHLPPLNQTHFIADPFRALREQLLLPANVVLNEAQPAAGSSRPSQKLLFLFDNLHTLMAQIDTGVLGQDTFHTLHDAIYKNHMGACLFTWEGSGPDASPTAQDIFSQAQIYDIGPLTPDAAIALVRQPVNFTVFKGVAEYIAALTQNRPYEIQLLCQGLYARQQKLNLNYVTVADVKAVQQQIVESGRHQTCLDREEQPPFALSAGKNAWQTVHRTTRPAIWQQRSFLAVSLLLLLLAGFIGGLPWLTGRSWPEQIAAFGGLLTTPTPTTAVPTTTPIFITVVESPTPQPTPTLTPTSTPTATPTPTHTPTPSATSTVTPTPSPSVLPTLFTRAEDLMPMALVPGGTFVMGSDINDFQAAPDEMPLHEVTLGTFYMDQYEVTVEQYAALLNRLGTYEEKCDRFDCAAPRRLAGYTSYLLEEDLGDGTVQYYPLTGFADYPINHVSWYGASVYCQSVGGRLPTEAEWEYAARGTDGRVYPWGNEPPNQERAVYQSEDYDNLKPVDALPRGASPFNIYGLAGSMWEWTADWYDENYYQESPAENPPGPVAGITKVIRGGAWPNNNAKDRIRSANRNSLAPDFFSSTVGFRCVMDP